MRTIYILIFILLINTIRGQKNVALYKTTTAQSTRKYGGLPSRAVDGITSGTYDDGGCTHNDESDTNGWWCVDLETSVYIHNITIYNRDQYGWRLNGFRLKLSSSGSCTAYDALWSSSLCYTDTHPIYTSGPIQSNPSANGPSTPDVYNITSCTSGLPFEARSVYINGPALSLCEVQIFVVCPTNCNVCDENTGYCTSCKEGWYGSTCAQGCPIGCLGACDFATGNCFQCKPNHELINGLCCSSNCNGGCYGNGYCTSCKEGWYGSTCSQPCPSNCNGGCVQNTGYCTSCKDGFYGNICYSECIGNCKSGCDRNNGICTECAVGYHGNTCEDTCAATCVDGCDRSTGRCVKCPPNTVGDFCNGTCSTGCVGGCGRDGVCTTGCIPGRYGDTCEEICSTSCTNITCTREGQCALGCTDGKSGPNCDLPCLSSCSLCQQNDSNTCLQCLNARRYGNQCQYLCPVNCTDGVCGFKNGDCTRGCVVGQSGPKCENNCPTGSYGEECGNTCGQCSVKNTCHHISGSCAQFGGCQDGFEGPTCEKASPPQTPTTIIAVVVALVVVAVIVLIVGVILFRRRRARDKADETLGVMDEGEGHKGGLNGPFTNGAAKSKTQEYANFSDNLAVTYENIKPGTSIHLKDLLEYVQKKKAEEQFEEEYQELPKGLCEPHAISLGEINKPKNRYKNICAFDHTRVVLELENGDPNSDYMNACFISMYGNTDNKNIASQGPVDTNMKEFLRMLWDVDASKVVMVTNLVEGGITKSLQYWPEEKKVFKVGSICMKLLGEDVFAHFTIRELQIQKESHEARVFYQFHYTSWPDKGVPIDIASLIEFRNIIHKTTSKRTGPMVVHCSAGIGRTGTFLALDYLIQEAEQEKKVDVFNCISIMRHQRTNMVQTLEQYIFIHDALCEWYVAYETSVTPTTFQKVYQNLLKKTDKNGNCRLLDKYQMMNSINTVPDEDEYAAALLPENKPKNRDPNILASKTYRVYLQRKNTEKSDYINAVYLSDYRKKNTSILTQTPLANTITDFWEMVLQTNTTTIIDMEHNSDTEASYLSADSFSRLDGYIITKTSEEDDASGHIKVISLDVKETSEYYNTDSPSTVLKVFQCNFWNDKSKTPPSVTPIFTLLTAVDTWNNKTDTGPVVIHCMDGVKKSGVISVISSILDNLNTEQDINILHTILKLRVVRPQIITSYEQFQFCFNALGEYFENYSTYANA